MRKNNLLGLITICIAMSAVMAACFISREESNRKINDLFAEQDRIADSVKHSQLLIHVFTNGWLKGVVAGMSHKDTYEEDSINFIKILKAK